MKSDRLEQASTRYDENWHGLDGALDRKSPEARRVRIALTTLQGMHAERRECVKEHVKGGASMEEVMTDSLQRIEEIAVTELLGEANRRLDTQGKPMAGTLANALYDVSHYRPKTGVKSSLFDTVFDAFKSHLEKEHGRSRTEAVNVAEHATGSREHMPPDMKKYFLAQIAQLKSMSSGASTE